MSETATLQSIRLDLGQEPDLRLFRNNVGRLQDSRGRWVAFGLHPGSGDLVGWRRVLILPEHVGQTFAVFVSVEVKAPGGRHPFEADQVTWRDAVQAAGGIAGVARSPEQARLVLGLSQRVPA